MNYKDPLKVDALRLVYNDSIVKGRINFYSYENLGDSIETTSKIQEKSLNSRSMGSVMTSSTASSQNSIITSRLRQLGLLNDKFKT